MASYQLEHLAYPDTFDKLEIEYKGNKVECKTNRINPDYSIYLSECKVNERLVKNDKEIDGFYHYGILKMTNQEYVDTYGKNLEDALKSYHDEHNEYPSDYTTLELPQLDKEVSCNVRINYDGSVYLTKCSVNEEEILDENTKDNYYHYGTKKYGIGDEVEYNGIEFYVINNSNDDSDSVTMLKKNPLTVSEVNLYGGVGTEDSHVNVYAKDSVGTARNSSGYGGMAYYTSETCGYVNGDEINSDCIIDYDDSDIKYVVDNWSLDKIGFSDLIKDYTGYSVRLITIEELRNQLGYGSSNFDDSKVLDCFKNGNYWYWTMSHYNFTAKVWRVIKYSGIRLEYYYVYTNNSNVVRPVVTLKKSALE